MLAIRHSATSATWSLASSGWPRERSALLRWPTSQLLKVRHFAEEAKVEDAGRTQALEPVSGRRSPCFAGNSSGARSGRSGRDVHSPHAAHPLCRQTGTRALPGCEVERTDGLVTTLHQLILANQEDGSIAALFGHGRADRASPSRTPGKRARHTWRTPAATSTRSCGARTGATAFVAHVPLSMVSETSLVGHLTPGSPK